MEIYLHIAQPLWLLLYACAPQNRLVFTYSSHIWGEVHFDFITLFSPPVATTLICDVSLLAKLYQSYRGTQFVVVDCFCFGCIVGCFLIYTLKLSYTYFISLFYFFILFIYFFSTFWFNFFFITTFNQPFMFNSTFCWLHIIQIDLFLL